MNERILAKASFLFGIIFIITVYAVDFLSGFWDYAFSIEANLFINFVVRSFWGFGTIALCLNLFIMWRHMYRNGKWAWFFSLFITFFVGAFIYYKIEYEKSGATNI